MFNDDILSDHGNFLGYIKEQKKKNLKYENSTVLNNKILIFGHLKCKLCYQNEII